MSTPEQIQACLPAPLAAEVSWHWLRLAVKSQLQYNAFVLTPGEASRQPPLEERLGPETHRSMARDFLVASLNECFHPYTVGLLLALNGDAALTPAELAERAQLSEPMATERLARLLQMGLAERLLENETYRLTSAGQTLAYFLAGAENALMHLIESQLAGWLNKEKNEEAP